MEANSDNGPTPAEFGLRLEDLGTDRARRAGYENMKGALVTAVDPASFAEDIGFARGDVITEVNHAPVNSVAEYRRAVSGLKAGQDVLFKGPAAIGQRPVRHGLSGRRRSCSRAVIGPMNKQ